MTLTINSTFEETGGCPVLDNSSTSEQISCSRFNRCSRSTCIHCATGKGHRKQENILININKRNLFRIVLTIKADYQLKPLVERLYSNFKRLIRSAQWKRQVLGGYYRLHVNYDQTNHHWTPHLDLLVEVHSIHKTIDKPSLRAQWKKLTGDSDILSVQKVIDTDLDRYRLTRYQLHAPFRDFADSASLTDLYDEATRNKRKFQKFGTWVNTKNEPDRWTRPPKPIPEAHSRLTGSKIRDFGNQREGEWDTGIPNAANGLTSSFQGN